MKTFQPQIGDSVVARRKVHQGGVFKNSVIGPVTDVWDTGCQIVTNAGTDISGNFSLDFSDWNFDKVEG